MSCNNSCNNCSCDNTENSYEDSEDIQEYQEFIPEKEYAVGEFFKINKEVFKVIPSPTRSCFNCDLGGILETYCEQGKCLNNERYDGNNVEFTLYDTLED